MLVTREHGYQLQVGPDDLDAQRFARLRGRGQGGAVRRPPRARARSALEAALALWRGAPLADLAYEPFAQAEIGRLEELRVTALEELVEAQARARPPRRGDRAARGSSSTSTPTGSGSRAQLMLALYRADRQADALQAYQDARRQLVEELGIEPGARLRELEAAVLAQDPALAVPDREPSPKPPPRNRTRVPAAPRSCRAASSPS